MEKTICELFAGVGGFRLGFNRLHSHWETVWFNQWEPKAATQWAHQCYVQHFGESEDINGDTTTGYDIAAVDKNTIPDHTLLVGGFPCQDYSVAHSLSTEKGIEGKKGVLWWQIYETIVAKQPPFCVFENVDRLLKSPSKQRGRDFGIMLSCLNQQGYSVEWRVVNAAMYGAAQRRRRVFIFAYRNDTSFATKQAKHAPSEIISKKGFFAKTFPVVPIKDVDTGSVPSDVFEASEKFQFAFCNAGYMTAGLVHTSSIEEIEEAPITLGEILERDVEEKYYIPKEKMDKWTYLKGAKKVPRTAANGHEYIYSEGPVGFPDSADKPGRTMLTSESTLNRSTHVVLDPATHRMRLLTPIETERMQGFDDNWTNTGMTQRMRYFCMGNALVVPMVTRMGKTLNKIIAGEP